MWIFSALYSTCIPGFIENIQKTTDTNKQFSLMGYMCSMFSIIRNVPQLFATS